MTKSTKRWEKKHSSLHHIVSTSMGGPEHDPENQYFWTQKKHRAYHEIFYNYLPSTVIGIIDLWTDKEGRLDPRLIGRDKLRAWQRVFPGGSPANAIRFIEKNFLPVELKFLNNEFGGDELDRKFRRD